MLFEFKSEKKTARVENEIMISNIYKVVRYLERKNVRVVNASGPFELHKEIFLLT